MSKIAILTDSSCDIPQELAEKYGIDIMSFHILLDDMDYIERESCTNTEFYDKMRAAKGVPSTAAITPIQFCEKYCQYVDEGYTDVIHVPINKSGSSTYNNALSAAADNAAEFVALAIQNTPPEQDTRFGVWFEPLLPRLCPVAWDE